MRLLLYMSYITIKLLNDDAICYDANFVRVIEIINESCKDSREFKIELLLM